jgi:hypothetical protein
MPAQFAHVVPLTPHAVSCVPTAQMLPTQHPPHGRHEPTSWHDPPTHVWFAPHGAHAWPPIPHSAFDGIVMHVLPRQHPFLQFAGPHAVCGWQVRSFGWPFGWQMSSIAAQFAHASPPFPHALSSVPPAHVVPEQHPPQLPALQVGVPVHVPPPPIADAHVWPVIAQLVH